MEKCFHWEKWNFEPISNSAHTIEMLIFGKDGVSPTPKYAGPFSRKKLSIGRQAFLGKSAGSCFRSCQEERVSQIHFPVMWTQLIYKFPPTMLGYLLKVEALTFCRTMQEFIIEINSLEDLKVVSGSVFLILTLTWGNDILSENRCSRNRWLRLKNTLWTQSMLLELRISCKFCLILKHL